MRRKKLEKYIFSNTLSKFPPLSHIPLESNSLIRFSIEAKQSTKFEFKD
jgi:hypothetical protein